MNRYLDFYRQSSINTATPKALLVRLHEKMLTELSAAQADWQAGNVSEMRKRVQLTQDIISYLRGCVDITVPASSTLISLYNYYLVRLAQLFIHPDTEVFEEMKAYFTSWRDTWSNAS